MSAGVGVWRDAVVDAVRARHHWRSLAEAASLELPPDDDAMCLLVRNVFLSTGSGERRQVLFASAGPETKIHVIGERIGKALAEISGARVAVMHSPSNFEVGVSTKKHPRPAHDPEPARVPGVQIGERLWRVPASLLPELAWRGEPAESEPAFQHMLFACSVNDGITPLFCRACDGAVLVLTANQTRRESALRATEVLRQCQAEVFGTVLDDRKFPIPESIYRRL